jgi:hypothetical protein
MAPLTAFEFSSSVLVCLFVASCSWTFPCLISDNFMKDVDGEVLQNLKRLGRKDPTTKVRLLVIFFSLLPLFFSKILI